MTPRPLCPRPLFFLLSLLIVLSTTLSSAVAGSEKGVGPAAPDIVLVLVDSLRADHLGCYGYSRDTSPALDAFSADAVRFTQTIASGPWTQPSIMTLFTSVSPDIHLRCHSAKPHSTNVVTLAETLRKAGYQTVGLTSNPMTHRRYGYARGFDYYDDYSVSLAPDSSRAAAAAQTATGATMNRLAEDWLLRRRDPAKPLFLFVLYMDVHWDYLPPAPYNRMFTDDPIPPPRNVWNLGRENVPEAARQRVVSAYDGEIRYTDVCISNLFASLAETPRAQNTVMAFCADHGEAFWERGLAGHGNNLYDEELHVPLIIRPPTGFDNMPPVGRVVNDQVGLIDVAPTFLDFAGVAPPVDWQGTSLMPLIKGEAATQERPIVLDVRIRKEGIVRGVRTSKYKVIGTHPYIEPSEVYDLAADPHETNNLVKAGIPLPDNIAALIPLLKPHEEEK